MIQRANVEERFQRNLERVRNLLKIFYSLNTAPGRPTMEKADLLRAAVMFLHATLEDLLRSSEELRFPTASPNVFRQMRWPARHAQATDKLTLVEFADFRGQTVDDVLLRAFQQHHERSNYNNEKDVVGALERMGVEKKPFETFLADLRAMMERRHQIAHRADFSGKFGRGQHMATPIGSKLVEQWFRVVEDFGQQLLSSL